MAWSGSREQFLLVDVENFATASRRYTGDIHNSSVVGLFMTPFKYIYRYQISTNKLRTLFF